MSKVSRLVSIIILLTLFLSACNLPGSGTEEPEQQSAEAIPSLVAKPSRRLLPSGARLLRLRLAMT